MQRRALGKGLKALIPVTDEKVGGAFEIAVEDVRPNRYQPRKIFDDLKLTELVNSIREKGVVQPIIVQKSDSGYELNPIEEARAYHRLSDEFYQTQEDIAKKVGKDRSSVANFLRLLKLPKEIQDSISNEELTMGHARALLSLDSAKEQISLKDRIIKRKMSVREVESYVNRSREAKKESSKKKVDIFKDRLEGELQRFFGTEVNILKARNKGKIEIIFYTDEDLERIIELIKGE